jgi:hypothetical protein
MYNTQQQMVNIMHSPQLTTPDEKKCTLLQWILSISSVSKYTFQPAPRSRLIAKKTSEFANYIYENPCRSLNFAKATCTKSYGRFLAEDYRTGSPEVPLCPFLTPSPTIHLEPKPYWYAHDTDVENSGSHKSDTIMNQMM